MRRMLLVIFVVLTMLLSSTGVTTVIGQEVKRDQGECDAFSTQISGHSTDGVYLFSDSGYGGRCSKFISDASDLRIWYVDNDHASSILIVGDYEATVYEHMNFEGVSRTFTESDADLADNSFNDRISSIVIGVKGDAGNCGDGTAEGVYLYSDIWFTGRCSRFTADASDLRIWYVDNDHASSIKIVGDYEATLYEHMNFEGASRTFTKSDYNLASDFFSDRTSSIVVGVKGDAGNCGNGTAEGVYLYSDAGYAGRCSRFTGDASDLRIWYVDNDHASSIRIVGDYEATVYEHMNFEGSSRTFTESDNDLANDGLNDQISSIVIGVKGAHGNCGSGLKIPPIAVVPAERFSVSIDQSTSALNVNATDSYDPDSPNQPNNGIDNWVWEVVASTDGPFPRNGMLHVGRTFTGPQLDFTPSAGDLGGWKFRLTVTDNEGQQGYTDFYITVREADYDGDGLSDRYEQTDTSYFPDPTNWQDADSDDDGLPDGLEKIVYTAREANGNPWFARVPWYYRGTGSHTDFNSDFEFEVVGFSNYATDLDSRDWEGEGNPGVKNGDVNAETAGYILENVIRGPNLIGYVLVCDPLVHGEKCRSYWQEELGTVKLSMRTTDIPFVNTTGTGPLPHTGFEFSVITENVSDYAKAKLDDMNLGLRLCGGYDDKFLPTSTQLRFTSQVNCCYVREADENERWKLSLKGVSIPVVSGNLPGGSGELGVNWSENQISIKPLYAEFDVTKHGDRNQRWTTYEVSSDKRSVNVKFSREIIDSNGIGKNLLLGIPMDLVNQQGGVNSLELLEVAMKGKVTWWIDAWVGDDVKVQEDTISERVYVLIQRSGYGGPNQIMYLGSGASALACPTDETVQSVKSGGPVNASQVLPAGFGLELSHLPATPSYPNGSGSAEPYSSIASSNPMIGLENSLPISVTEESCIDTDGDGKCNQLMIQVTANITETGYYDIYGKLLYEGLDWVFVDSYASGAISLTAGSNRIPLYFDGDNIRRLNITDTLIMTNTNLFHSGNPAASLPESYNTQVYSPFDFDEPDATFTGDIVVADIDSDGDDFYNALRFTTGISVSEAGLYQISGGLYSLDGKLVDYYRSEVDLSNGQMTAALEYSGPIIRHRNLDGPYVLVGVSLLNQEGRQVSFVSHPFTTTNYSHLDFQPDVLELDGNFSDEGIDTDGNSKYNFLKINIDTHAYEAGDYRVQGALTDIFGKMIRFQSDVFSLGVGNRDTYLLFDGIAIGENNVNGPYYLSILELLDADTGNLIRRYTDVYTTADYLASDFENGSSQQPQLAYVDGATLVLNMGSEARRNARGIASSVIDEEFTVQQLSETLPGTFSVSAFGLTQIYSGASSVLAEADDGNDVVTLEGGTDNMGNFVPFTAPSTIDGGTGDDLIFSGGGDDTLTGGSGKDNIWGGAGNDNINGNEGDDVLHGGEGDDALTGDVGNDTLMGDQGMDTLYGDVALTCSDAGTIAGNDQLFGGPGNDNLYGGAGADVIVGEAGDDTLCGNDGDDFLDGDYEDVTLTDGHDQLYGGPGNDTLNGCGGEDTLFGDDGDDTLSGDAGNDTLYGGPADDQVDGGPGDDYLEGNQGVDTLDGGEGQDDLIGGSSTAATADAGDTLSGGPGHDVILGDNGKITRPGGTESADGAVIRHVILFDLTSADPAVKGPDEIHGNEGNDKLYGGGNDDTIHGDDGDDYMEGNPGSDSLFGDGGQDDMIGGSSAGPDGVVGGGLHPTHLADGDDTMRGGPDSDVMLGDNGAITRPVDGAGLWTRLRSDNFDIVIRSVCMARTPDQAGAFGNDTMQGDDGHDEMYGQLGHDYMKGNAGEDAMVGDLGLITSNIEDGSREELIRPKPPFIEATIFKAGTLSRLVELYAFQTGEGGEGNDIMLGGSDQDNMHGGPGDDLMNGNAGEDHLFGGDGDDVMWGGPAHDHLWGGHGDDHLDVLPRMDMTPADPSEWFTYGWLDNYQDMDYIYGGWGQDAMQADVADQGPVPGDRLIDWVGAYNVYYLCPGLYGEFVITRNHSPHVMQFLQQLAEGDGAFNPDASDTSGFREVAMVFPKDIKHNSHPPHPENPGHFTCDSPDLLLSSIVISPDTATIKAGEEQAYTAQAFDANDNLLGDVTEDTTFSVVESGHGGNWVDNTYTANKAGQWTVQASFAGREARCSLTVEPNIPVRLVLSADPTTIPADGESTAVIAATVTDAWDNLVADGTSVTFSTTAGTLGADTALTQDGLGTTTITSASTGGVAVVTVTAGEIQEAVEVGFEATATEKPIYLPLIRKK